MSHEHLQAPDPRVSRALNELADLVRGAYPHATFQVAPADMIVIHDDLDLASGKLRLRADGSSGGQNGIRSIIDRLGTAEFARGKVGIGRPPGRMDPAAYVLQNFSEDEEAVFGPLRTRVCDAIEVWLTQGIEAAMNQFNG